MLFWYYVFKVRLVENLVTNLVLCSLNINLHLLLLGHLTFFYLFNYIPDLGLILRNHFFFGCTY